jgi:hypothetical protein
LKDNDDDDDDDDDDDNVIHLTIIGYTDMRIVGMLIILFVCVIISAASIFIAGSQRRKFNIRFNVIYWNHLSIALIILKTGRYSNTWSNKQNCNS